MKRRNPIRTIEQALELARGGFKTTTAINPTVDKINDASHHFVFELTASQVPRSRIKDELVSLITPLLGMEKANKIWDGFDRLLKLIDKGNLYKECKNQKSENN